MDCSLGQVVDLSASGARILSRRKLSGLQTFVVTGQDRRPLRIKARVVWHRQHAAGEHVHGLRFERVTFEQRDRVLELIDLLDKGRSAPKPYALSRYGLSGAMMVLAAFSLCVIWFTWTRYNPTLHDTLPGLHRALTAIPEVDALLLIAASGCALLGVAQRITRPDLHRLVPDQNNTERSNKPLNEIDQIKRSQSVLNCILESSLGGVAVLETRRQPDNTFDGFQIQLINPAGEQLIGKTESQLVGRTLESALPELVKHELYQDLLAIVNEGDPLQKEYQLGEDGKHFLIAMVKLDDGIAVTFLDNTESQKQREALTHSAYHDELTGLPNRKALIEHVDSSIDRTQRSAGHRSALLFLDFDRFKNVNDTLGHEAGDQLLINIAARLHENLRESDSFTLGASERLPARLGGDEFVVLLDGINTENDAVAVAQRLLKVFAEPHDIAGQQVVSTASIGIAVNEGAYESAEEILRDADAALYVAKQTGKCRYVMFDQDMQDKIVKRLKMEKNLRHAVERDELDLVYEPIIDLQTGQAAGFEALVRWHHPEFGTVSPVDFIPLAEEINLIGEIGEWVVKHACEQLAQWRSNGVENVFLNVNLSRGQLYEPGLVGLFEEQIKTHQLNPKELCIELTETMVMNDLDFMADKLTQLKELGLGLALDDFGTGYSSLSVLHKLPFDTLKIDRAFLDDARLVDARDQGRRSSAIIATITELADHLRLDVIAEGIAEPDQVATLQALACRYAQGWHFSKPLDPADALALLKDTNPHPSCLAAQLNLSA